MQMYIERKEPFVAVHVTEAKKKQIKPFLLNCSISNSQNLFEFNMK